MSEKPLTKTERFFAWMREHEDGGRILALKPPKTYHLWVLLKWTDFRMLPLRMTREQFRAEVKDVHRAWRWHEAALEIARVNAAPKEEVNGNR